MAPSLPPLSCCSFPSSPRPSSALQTQLYSPNSVLSHHWGRVVPLCLPIGIALNRVGVTDAPHGKLTFILKKKKQTNTTVKPFPKCSVLNHVMTFHVRADLYKRDGQGQTGRPPGRGSNLACSYPVWRATPGWKRHSGAGPLLASVYVGPGWNTAPICFLGVQSNG